MNIHSRALKRGVVLVFVGTLLALFSTTLFYPSNTISKEPMSFKAILEWQLIWWYLWVILAPLVLWLSERFRIRKQGWPRTILAHMGASIVISLTHLTMYILVAYVLGGTFWSDLTNEAKTTQLGPVILWWLTSFQINFHLRLLVYLVLLMMSHAVYYHGRYREEEVVTAKLETQLAEAQIQALKMQLQPHFLFNTLHSLSALLYTDRDAAEEMIQRLIRFLNLTLENPGEQIVTLQKELEFLNTYLEIEQVRFQERLRVNMDIDPQTLQACVPNLIMQPIVENAIRHGIAPLIEPGVISIRSSKVDGRLQIQIQDNGPGMVENGNGNGNGKSREGLGLANTRSRLVQLYGKSQKMEMSSGKPCGLLVTLEIPFQTPAGAIV